MCLQSYLFHMNVVKRATGLKRPPVIDVRYSDIPQQSSKLSDCLMLYC
jgi:hypothetical protein